MSDAVRVFAVGAVTLSYGLGGALSVAVLGALTEPMHKPVAQVVSRVWAWAGSRLSVVLRALVVVQVWLSRRAARYAYRGNRRPVNRGQHRPAVVTRWQAAQAYNVRQAPRVPRDRWAALMIEGA